MEKARAGIPVRVVVDALGSHAYFGSRQFFATLAAAGVEVMFHDLVPPDRHGAVGTRRFRPRLWQTGRVEHRKLVMVDGTVVTQPKYASWFDGPGWDVENHGVDPDIEVEIAPCEHLHDDRDRQLDRAVDEVLKRLKRTPAATPPPLPPPRVRA